MLNSHGAYRTLYQSMQDVFSPGMYGGKWILKQLHLALRFVQTLALLPGMLAKMHRIIYKVPALQPCVAE